MSNTSTNNKDVASMKKTSTTTAEESQTTSTSSSMTQPRFSSTSGFISSINKTITQPMHTLAQVAGGVLDLLQGKTQFEGEEFVHTEMTPEQAPVHQMEPEKVEEKKYSYEENITKIHEKVEQHRSEKTKREQEALVHSALLSEAKALEMDATRQEAEFILKEQELEHQVKLNLKREMQFEAKRAAAHARAMEAENERAKAEAEKLMFAKEREYARQLEEKHAIGQLRAEVLTKQHEMQAKELQLAEERIRFERNNAEVLSAEIQGPSSLEIEVGVKPRYLPEKHKIVSVAPEATIASTLVSENYELPPEEEIEDIFESLTFKSSSTTSETKTAAPSHDQPTAKLTMEKTKAEASEEQQEKSVSVQTKDKDKAKGKLKKSEQQDTSGKKDVMRSKGKDTKTWQGAESQEPKQQQQQSQWATS